MVDDPASLSFEEPVTSAFFGPLKSLFVLNPKNYDIIQGKSRQYRVASEQILGIGFAIFLDLVAIGYGFLTCHIMSRSIKFSDVGVFVATFTTLIAAVLFSIYYLIYVPRHYQLIVPGEVLDGEIILAEFKPLYNNPQFKGAHAYDLSISYVFTSPKNGERLEGRTVFQRFDIEPHNLPKPSTPIKILYFGTIREQHSAL